MIKINIDKSNIKYPQRGEIWMINLKNNQGSEQNGIRPCIIMNNAQKKERTCVMIPASNTKRDHCFEILNYSFLIHQIRAIDTSRLIRKITRLPKQETKYIKKYVYFYHSRTPSSE